MNKRKNYQRSAGAEYADDIILGKRHDYQGSDTCSFLSKAAAIGFTKEEMKALGRVYLGVDEKDTRDNGDAEQGASGCERVKL